MFVEMDDARFGENRLASGFEIFARDSRGRYVDQVAMGEAASLDESKAFMLIRLTHTNAEHTKCGRLFRLN
jgi:hypothetical protein